MSESDKSGKPELSKKDRKAIDKFIDMVINDDGQEYELADAAEWGILHERSAAQARIAELETRIEDILNQIEEAIDTAGSGSMALERIDLIVTKNRTQP